jgi:hypothetical protein
MRSHVTSPEAAAAGVEDRVAASPTAPLVGFAAAVGNRAFSALVARRGSLLGSAASLARAEAVILRPGIRDVAERTVNRLTPVQKVGLQTRVIGPLDTAVRLIEDGPTEGLKTAVAVVERLPGVLRSVETGAPDRAILETAAESLAIGQAALEAYVGTREDAFRQVHADWSACLWTLKDLESLAARAANGPTPSGPPGLPPLEEAQKAQLAEAIKAVEGNLALLPPPGSQVAANDLPALRAKGPAVVVLGALDLPDPYRPRLRAAQQDWTKGDDRMAVLELQTDQQLRFALQSLRSARDLLQRLIGSAGSETGTDDAQPEPPAP